jgi:ribose transport system ATP-binding protein
VSVLRDGVLVATRQTGTLQRRELVELVAGEEIADLHAHADEPARPAAPIPVLHVMHLSAGAVSDVSFAVPAGEIVGVAGITGSGREEILSAIFGGRRRSAGQVLIGTRPLPSGRPALSVRCGLAYLPPDRRRLGGLMTLSARENLTLADLRPVGGRAWIRLRRERAAVRSWFARLEVRPVGAAESALSTFSGGNQQKIIFAKWLCLAPQVFLLDEPTQGVDIGAKALLHRQLKEAARGGMGIVVASSDTEELAALCSRVLVLRNGRVVTTVEGAAISPSRLSRAALSEEDGS